MSNSELQTVTATPLATQPQPSIEMILQCAVEKGQIDVVERLVALQERMKAEQARETFNTALAIFQAACPVIVKRHAGHGNQYTYAKLEDIAAQIKPHMQTARLHYAFSTEQSGDTLTVHCRVTHADGHSETSHASFPVNSKAGMSEQQKVGSAMTYAKRYALMNALGIVVADEDNDAAFPNPNPAPDADPAAPHAPTRQERQQPTLAEKFAALKRAYAAKFGKDKDAFVKWCANTLKADGEWASAEAWNEKDITLCMEALK
jgi:hypothetical protein